MLSSIQQRRVLLVLAVAIPLVIATALVIYQLAVTQREGQRIAMLNSTRVLAAAVDSEIQTYLAIGRTLATAGSLGKGDLRDFYDRAVVALASWPDTWMILADAQGGQLLNTFRPYGEVFPPVAHTEPYRRAIETKEWQIPDVYTGQVTKRRVISLYVSVVVEGRAIYALIIARDHANAVGRPASNGWREAAKLGSEGQFENISVEGEPLYSAFVNSRFSGWSISTGATQNVIEAPFRRSLL